MVKVLFSGVNMETCLSRWAVPLEKWLLPNPYFFSSCIIILTPYIKVKQSHYRSGQTLKVPGGWDSQISWQSAHKGGKVVSLTHRLPLPPRKYSWYLFVLEAESTSGSQCSRKDYVNEKFQWHHQEPMTFQLVAQCATVCLDTICSAV